MCLFVTPIIYIATFPLDRFGGKEEKAYLCESHAFMPVIQLFNSFTYETDIFRNSISFTGVVSCVYKHRQLSLCRNSYCAGHESGFGEDTCSEA